MSAGLPPDEHARLAALRELQLLDTAADPRFDVITRLASKTLGVPIALVSLVDESRQWFKSRYGLDADQTPREVAFCAHTIQCEDLLVVPDTTQDPRFSSNPLVTGALGLRAYAGVPLRTSLGFAVGTLCALDQKPHAFTPDELETLKDLAALVQREILARESVVEWQQRAQQSSEAAQALEQIYASTVDWAGIGIGLMSLSGAWLRVNPRLCQILGRSAPELQGSTWDAFVQTQDLTALRQTKADLLSGHTPSGTLDQRFLRPDGSCGWIEVTISLLRDPQGQPQSFVVLIDDITQRRATESALHALRDDLEDQVLARTQELQAAKNVAEEANAAKSHFISNINHELRTPLNAVLGYARRLHQTQLDAQQRSDLRKLQIAGESLFSLVNDVLDMSKIEAGEFQLAHDFVDLDQILFDLESMMSVTAASKRLALRLSPRPDGMPRYFVGDAMRLRQILVNLVGNAIKFTDHGHVEIRLSSMDAEHLNKLRLRFEVQDTGVGIDASKLPNLFRRFKQVNEGNTRKHGGTGLGLAIVKELAQHMDGRVQVHSQQGVGSTFVVEVELMVAPEQAQLQSMTDAWAASPEAGAEASARLQGRKILLVDDSPSNLDIAASMLMEEGADVFVCTNGKAALDWLQQPDNVADVVLMDVQMPVMDGNAAVAEIRRHPVHSRLPVIAMTASSTLSERQMSLDAGMSDYVTKPISHGQLMDALCRCL